MLEKAPKMKNKGPSPDVFDHSHLNKLLLTQSSPTDNDLKALSSLLKCIQSTGVSRVLERVGILPIPAEG